MTMLYLVVHYCNLMKSLPKFKQCLIFLPAGNDRLEIGKS